MKTKQKIKMAVDLLMTIALLLLMPYEMIGEAAHEWIGAGMRPPRVTNASQLAVFTGMIGA